MNVQTHLIIFLLIGVAVASSIVVILLVAGVIGINEGASSETFWVATIFSLTLLGAAALVVSLWLKSFGRRMSQIVESADQISTGDLEPSLPVDAPGEIGRLSKALHAICGRQRTMLFRLDALAVPAEGAGESFGGVKEISRLQSQAASQAVDAVGQLSVGLLSAAQEMESMAERNDESSSAISKMDVAIRRIAEAFGGLSTSIDQASTMTRKGDDNVRALTNDIAELSSRINAAKTALGEMVTGVQAAHDDARNASGIMSRLESATERIGAVIGAVIKGSDAVHVSNNRILDVMTSLEARVSRVNDVIDVINNLAERTKLLSINASIIASESGEHGRAFAVIAREVKDLAQSTSAAISEISGAIRGLKEGFTQTVATIQKGQEDVDHGIGLARNAVVLLHSIPDEVQKAAVMNSEIASRTEHHVKEGRQVEDIIGKVIMILDQVGQLFTEQILRNEQTLKLFLSTRSTADQVLRSTKEYATVSSGVSSITNEITDDFNALANQVRIHLTSADKIVGLSENMLAITDRNRRKTEDLSNIMDDLNRYVQEIKGDFLI